MLAYIVARYDSYVNIFKKKDVMSKINSWRLRKTVNGLDPILLLIKKVTTAGSVTAT